MVARHGTQVDATRATLCLNIFHFLQFRFRFIIILYFYVFTCHVNFAYANCSVVNLLIVEAIKVNETDHVSSERPFRCADRVPSGLWNRLCRSQQRSLLRSLRMRGFCLSDSGSGQRRKDTCTPPSNIMPDWEQQVRGPSESTLFHHWTCLASETQSWLASVGLEPIENHARINCWWMTHEEDTGESPADARARLAAYAVACGRWDACVSSSIATDGTPTDNEQIEVTVAAAGHECYIHGIIVLHNPDKTALLFLPGSEGVDIGWADAGRWLNRFPETPVRLYLENAPNHGHFVSCRRSVEGPESAFVALPFSRSGEIAALCSGFGFRRPRISGSPQVVRRADDATFRGRAEAALEPQISPAPTEVGVLLNVFQYLCPLREYNGVTPVSRAWRALFTTPATWFGIVVNLSDVDLHGADPIPDLPCWNGVRAVVSQYQHTQFVRSMRIPIYASLRWRSQHGCTWHRVVRGHACLVALTEAPVHTAACIKVDMEPFENLQRFVVGLTTSSQPQELASELVALFDSRGARSLEDHVFLQFANDRLRRRSAVPRWVRGGTALGSDDALPTAALNGSVKIRIGWSPADITVRLGVGSRYRTPAASRSLLSGRCLYHLFVGVVCDGGTSALRMPPPGAFATCIDSASQGPLPPAVMIDPAHSRAGIPAPPMI